MEYGLQSEGFASSYAADVAPKWDKELCDALRPHFSHVDNENALAAECRAGQICDLVLESIGTGRLMAVDPSREMLDVARGRLAERDGQSVFFNCQSATSLSYASGVFGRAVCLTAPLTKKKADLVVGELNRVVKPGGLLAIAAPVSGTDVFLDLLIESICACPALNENLLADVAAFRDDLVCAESLSDSLVQRGATVVATGTVDAVAQINYPQALYFTPLLQHLLLPHWLDVFSLPAQRKELMQDVIRRVQYYFEGLNLAIVVSGAWFVAKTSEDRHEEIYEIEDLGVAEVEDAVSVTSRDLFDPLDDDAHEPPL